MPQTDVKGLPTPVGLPPKVAKPKAGPITVPPVELEDGALVDTPLEPEPAIGPADVVRPTQEQLAAESIAQQNVATRSMTPHIDTEEEKAERVAKAKAAVQVRWSKKYDWQNADLDEALSYLAEIRAEVERGGLILQSRVSNNRVEEVKCFGCDNIIKVSEGRYAKTRVRNNYETGIPESAYACSARCALIMDRDFTHPNARTPHN